MSEVILRFYNRFTLQRVFCFSFFLNWLLLWFVSGFNKDEGTELEGDFKINDSPSLLQKTTR
ncbi:MAG: hypothetical protein HC867_00810 [Bacteroidia bacterium]|nr:hypothetical protein [Bacteroidia bacterium]